MILYILNYTIQGNNEKVRNITDSSRHQPSPWTKVECLQINKQIISILPNMSIYFANYR